MNNAINIIMADENEESIKGIINNLPADKFNVVATARDGATLIEKIKQYRPDVVIMDLVLPELDGFAVMEKLNKENIDTNIMRFMVYLVSYSN